MDLCQIGKFGTPYFGEKMNLQANSHYVSELELLRRRTFELEEALWSSRYSAPSSKYEGYQRNLSYSSPMKILSSFTYNGYH